MAIGNNSLRKTLILETKEIGYQIITLIDPVSFVSNYCFLGEGSVVFPHAVLEAKCHVDKGCVISSNTTIHHNTIVNEYSLIYSNTVIRPEASVGSMSRIGSNCIVTFGKVLEEKFNVSDGTLIDEN